MFFTKLKLPVELKPYDYGMNNPEEFCELEMSMDHINRELHDFLRSLNLEIIKPRYFHSGPPHIYRLHIDIPTRPNRYTRLNWVFGGAGSEMVWYASKPGKVPTVMQNNLGENYQIYDLEDCDEIGRGHVIGPNLVDVGTIHNLIGGSEQRHCYSFFLRDKKGNGDRLEWSQAIEKFAPFMERS